MANTQDHKTSTAIEKAAHAEVGLSDYRRDRAIHAVINKGYKVENTEDMVAALLKDFQAGKVTAQEAGGFLQIMDRAITVEDQNIRKDEMGLKLELAREKSVRVSARNKSRK